MNHNYWITSARLYRIVKKRIKRKITAKIRMEIIRRNQLLSNQKTRSKFKWLIKSNHRSLFIKKAVCFKI